MTSTSGKLVLPDNATPKSDHPTLGKGLLRDDLKLRGRVAYAYRGSLVRFECDCVGHPGDSGCSGSAGVLSRVHELSVPRERRPLHSPRSLDALQPRPSQVARVP